MTDNNNDGQNQLLNPAHSYAARGNERIILTSRKARPPPRASEPSFLQSPHNLPGVGKVALLLETNL